MRFIAIALLAAGCSIRTATLPDGRVLYSSKRFGNRESIKRIEFRDENGVTFIMEGYLSDQAEALGEVAERTAEGVAKGLKP